MEILLFERWVYPMVWTVFECPLGKCYLFTKDDQRGRLLQSKEGKQLDYWIAFKQENEI